MEEETAQSTQRPTGIPPVSVARPVADGAESLQCAVHARARREPALLRSPLVTSYGEAGPVRPLFCRIRRRLPEHRPPERRAAQRRVGAPQVPRSRICRCQTVGHCLRFVGGRAVACRDPPPGIQEAAGLRYSQDAGGLSEQVADGAPIHAGTAQLIVCRPFVRVPHLGLGRVDDGVPGTEDRIAPGKILRVGDLGERETLPHAAAHHAAYIVERTAQLLLLER